MYLYVILTIDSTQLSLSSPSSSILFIDFCLSLKLTWSLLQWTYFFILVELGDMISLFTFYFFQIKLHNRRTNEWKEGGGRRREGRREEGKERKYKKTSIRMNIRLSKHLITPFQISHSKLYLVFGSSWLPFLRIPFLSSRRDDRSQFFPYFRYVFRFFYFLPVSGKTESFSPTMWCWYVESTHHFLIPMTLLYSNLNVPPLRENFPLCRHLFIPTSWYVDEFK